MNTFSEGGWEGSWGGAAPAAHRSHNLCCDPHCEHTLNTNQMKTCVPALPQQRATLQWALQKCQQAVAGMSLLHDSVVLPWSCVSVPAPHHCLPGSQRGSHQWGASLRRPGPMNHPSEGPACLNVRLEEELLVSPYHNGQTRLGTLCCFFFVTVTMCRFSFFHNLPAVLTFI